MFQFYNPNPLGRFADDCVPRALSKLFNQTWDKIYTDLCLTGYALGVMPSNNEVSMSYMKQHGYQMHILSNQCPECVTIKQFSELYSNGKYLLATGDHVVALIQGVYYDVLDSGNEIVSYYFSK